MEIAAVLAAAIAHHRQLAILRILGHAVVDTGVLDRNPDHGMLGHVGNFLAAKEYCPPVAQRFLVLFRCSQSHLGSPAILVSPRRRAPAALDLANSDRPI